jgi:outer membrane protein insertion porin family
MILRRVLLALLLICGSLSVALAQGTAVPAPAGRIQDIRVEGMQRIEASTVLSYIALNIGDAFDQAKIDESLKSLFATGYFSDISFYREGNVLIVEVKENPIINEIAFEGNDKVKDDELTAETQLRSRVVYTRSKVQEDLQRILQIYKRLGYYSATVDPKIIPMDQNRVNLVYEISESGKTAVRSINFVGNKIFSEEALREVISTKESRWYRFFASDDNYDEDRVKYDEDLLRKFYLSKGYADFKVQAAAAELSPDQKDFFMTYTVMEGERYKVGKINLENRLNGLDPNSLVNMVKTVPGEWYNADYIEDTIIALTDHLADNQFAFVDIKPQIQVNRDSHTIDINYVISESPRVYIERIDIGGNERTLDAVVRREMLLSEGDAFNRSKLKRSEQRLRDLQFFKDVKVEVQPGSQADLAVIKITVEEQSTGELSIGAGFSTAEGPLGDFRIRERNFLGKGQDLQLATTLSGRRQQYDMSFTEPYFLERDLAAGVDLFSIERDYQRESSYDQKRDGFGLRLGYPLAENTRQDLRYTMENNNISNVNALASRYILEQQGERLTSKIGHTITYNRLDSKINPTDGYMMSISNDLAGLAGDARYIGNKAKAATYIPLDENKNWIFSSTAEGGYILGLGQDVFISDRYFLGSNSLKGFDNSGIGPRDIATGDALGGNRYIKGNVELTTPMVGLAREKGVNAHVFSEAGSLGQVDTIGSRTNLRDNDALRLSVGTGISWRSPLGPLRGDFAVPIIKEDYDETRLFNFAFGTRF